MLFQAKRNGLPHVLLRLTLRAIGRAELTALIAAIIFHHDPGMRDTGREATETI